VEFLLVKSAFIFEYLALLAAGATHVEALAQVAQSNEVAVTDVEAECCSH
jgi:hypothetical protein